MPSTSFLKKLGDNDLEELVKKEGLRTIPKNYEREDLIKYLEGVLTTEKIKKYQSKFSEREIERDIHIHERVKERSLETTSFERTRTKFDRNSAIISLSKAKVSKQVVESVTDYLHEAMPSGGGVNFYDKMNDKTLRLLYDTFVEKSPDISGVSFEFLCTDWLVHKYAEIRRVENRHKFPKIGEIDIVGYDSGDLPIVVAECKDRNVSYSDVDKWIRNSEKLTNEYAGQLYKDAEIRILQSFFFTSKGFSQGVVDRLRNDDKIKDDFYVINKGVFKGGKISFEPHMYDVRDGKFYREF